MNEEDKKLMVARFYELLKAEKLPVVTDYDKSGIIIFDPESTDVRATFAVNKHFEELLTVGVTYLELDKRDITIYLFPDESNPLTIFISPIPGVANGERMVYNLSGDKLKIDDLRSFLHQYFTNKEFKADIIQDQEHYVFIKK